MEKKKLAILALIILTALIFALMLPKNAVREPAPDESDEPVSYVPPVETPPPAGTPEPSPAPSEADEEEPRILPTYFGNITAADSAEKSEGFDRYEKKYTYFDGDVFCSGRIIVPDTQPALYHVAKLSLEGSYGTVRHYDGSKWAVTPLEETALESGMYFISTESEQMIVCLPFAYRQLENAVLQEIEGFAPKLLIKNRDGAWSFEIYAPQTEAGAYIEYMYVLSKGELIDWTRPDAALDWAGFLFTGKSRWTYDGYYYTAPYNYIPTGEGCFHRLSAAYISTKFINRSSDYRAARIMGLAMLDMMCALQNEMGYFPTLAGSQWLLDDYDIGPGFFDTRFNTDLVTAMITAVTDLGAEWLRPYIDNFCTFYLNWLDSWAIERNGAILAPDYWDEDGCKVSHTSLNHQLAEALMVLKLFRLTGEEVYLEKALGLTAGLTAKTDFWLSGPDGDLQYGYYAGSSIGTDYPYLTYNDLFKLNNELYLITGHRDKDLDRLMAHKLAWMVKNDVTEYLK